MDMTIYPKGESPAVRLASPRYVNQLRWRRLKDDRRRLHPSAPGRALKTRPEPSSPAPSRLALGKGGSLNHPSCTASTRNLPAGQRESEAEVVTISQIKRNAEARQTGVGPVSAHKRGVELVGDTMSAMYRRCNRECLQYMFTARRILRFRRPEAHHAVRFQEDDEPAKSASS